MRESTACAKRPRDMKLYVFYEETRSHFLVLELRV